MSSAKRWAMRTPFSPTALGVKNLKRVAKMLVPLTAARPDEMYTDLPELYEATLAQWTQEMNHVIAIVGGVNAQTKHTGDPGPVFTSGAERAAEAARSLS